MADFLLAYHGGKAGETEQERAASMEAWGKWFQGLGPALVDGGKPAIHTKTIASGGAVTDGGGANPVNGYSVIRADSLDAAVKLAKGCPHLASGGSIEVCETMDMM